MRPSTPTELMIAEIWCQILDIESGGINDRQPRSTYREARATGCVHRAGAVDPARWQPAPLDMMIRHIHGESASGISIRQAVRGIVAEIFLMPEQVLAMFSATFENIREAAIRAASLQRLPPAATQLDQSPDRLEIQLTF